jgi:hypothetical protein
MKMHRPTSCDSKDDFKNYQNILKFLPLMKIAINILQNLTLTFTNQFTRS